MCRNFTLGNQKGKIEVFTFVYNLKNEGENSILDSLHTCPPGNALL